MIVIYRSASKGIAFSFDSESQEWWCHAERLPVRVTALAAAKFVKHGSWVKTVVPAVSETARQFADYTTWGP